MASLALTASGRFFFARPQRYLKNHNADPPRQAWESGHLFMERDNYCIDHKTA